MENIINNELEELLNKLSTIISNNNLPEQDLKLINYYFNAIYGLFIAFNNNNTTAVIKKDKPKIKTKRKYTRKKVYKTEEVMQIVDNNENKKE